MKDRTWWGELLDLPLYFCEGKYFYAWDGRHARKKIGNKKLFIINDYGEKIKCGFSKEGI